MDKILVVAAHPDDEVIGPGGTVRRMANLGSKVKCLILGEGATSRTAVREGTSRKEIDSLHQDTLKASKILGYQDVIFANLPDNRFDSIDLLDIIKIIEKEVKTFRPHTIFTHHKDLNIDHKLTFQATLTATRPVNDYSVKEIYTFETLSSTEWNFRQELFAPNLFIDIEETIHDKLKAMEMYQTELCRFPHPRSKKALLLNAQRWGTVVSKQYVESFDMVRKVV